MMTSTPPPQETLTPDRETGESVVGSQRIASGAQEDAAGAQGQAAGAQGQAAGAQGEASPTGHAPRTERQAINYCPYCSEEDLFPLEGGGWECRSCRRAFSVSFKGLVAPGRAGGER